MEMIRENAELVLELCLEKKQQLPGKTWDPQNQPELPVLELEGSLECPSTLETKVEEQNSTLSQPTFPIPIPKNTLTKSI